MNTKMLEIEKLNKALNNKNNELKKIKHDYGSQISYINGLCLMDQYDRLKELLQKIIEGNDLVSDNVKIISNDNSIIAHIVNSLNTQGVHIIIDEEFDLNKIDIPEHDMHKILSNIIKNALTALNNNGLIIIKTYKIFTTVYVSIKNNGPKVDSDIIDKIFDFGFTTKEEFNNDDHGCGLSIVKELAENNNGKVYVDSNSDYTEFKLVFKI
ncbi:sensor histidine kinase [Romboutsia weinsteinii]|nr:ATP-binding protein [Romboutsia weinsteinii]